MTWHEARSARKHTWKRHIGTIQINKKMKINKHRKRGTFTRNQCVRKKTIKEIREYTWKIEDNRWAAHGAQVQGSEVMPRVTLYENPRRSFGSHAFLTSTGGREREKAGERARKRGQMRPSAGAAAAGRAWLSVTSPSGSSVALLSPPPSPIPTGRSSIFTLQNTITCSSHSLSHSLTPHCLDWRISEF